MKRILATAISLLMLILPYAYAETVTVNVSVAPAITVTANYNTVNFGTLSAGTSDNEPTPVNTAGEYNFTVSTNGNYKVEASGTDFTGTTSSFAISNLKLDTNTTASNLAVGDAVALSTSTQTIDTNIPPSATTNYHGYWLTIPSNQFAESYSSTVTITISNV